jgi:hypothetical protein
MDQTLLPDYVFDEIKRFIHANYHSKLPNSLLVAQAFILCYQEYGREFGLCVVNKAIECLISQGLF